VVLAALAAIALGASNAGALGSFGHTVYARAASIVNPKTVTESSFTARSNEDDLAIAAITGSPFTGEGIGVGFGAYTNNSNSAAGTEVYVPQLFIHNTYLGIWVWLGFFGIAAFAYLAWRITAVSVRLWLNHGPGAVSPLAVALGLLCLGIQSTFQTNMYYPPAVVALVAGLAYIDCWIGDRDVGERSADAAQRNSVDDFESADFEQQDPTEDDLYPERIVKIA
jgi:O-antigen ligase